MDNKHKKKLATTLPIIVMQFETPQKSILPQSAWQSSRKQTTRKAGKNVGKNEPLYTNGGHVN
jgi:hypothetical protein